MYDQMSIENRFELFNNSLVNVYEKSFPIKKKVISLKRLGSPWMSDTLLDCVSEKHRLHRLSLNDSNYLDAYIKDIEMPCAEKLRKQRLDTSLISLMAV